MKFSTVKSDILAELQLLQGIVEKRNTLPILANIFINARDDEVELIGTDLEVGLKTHFAAKIQEPGAVTVSGKKIFEIVRSLGQGSDIVFSTSDEQMMEIRAGASRFKVLCLPKDDYPQVPEPRFEKELVLPLAKIKEMIDRVYCAITQEQRYYLNGALMILNDGLMELVSTDGHRLAYTRCAFDELKVGEEIRGIISKKTLAELRKFEDESVRFDMDENNLFFNIGNRTMISRIIEGKFPNFEAVIPVDNPNALVFQRDEISDAIRRVSLLSTERSRGVKMNISKNRVELHSSNPEMGEAHDEVMVEYDGNEFEIGFNSQYLLDFLTTIKNENVRFEMKDENSAVLMRSDKAQDGGGGVVEYKYVLMPMKI